MRTNRIITTALILGAGLAGVLIGFGGGYKTGYERGIQNAPQLRTEKKARRTAKLNKVIDGDTIVLENGENGEYVRLLGINTPELRKKGVSGGEPYSHEAKARLEELISGSELTLELDLQDSNTRDEDRFGRTLGYVLINGQNTSVILTREGYARAFMHEGLKYEAEILKAEQEAQEAKRGIWAQQSK